MNRNKYPLIIIITILFIQTALLGYLTFNVHINSYIYKVKQNKKHQKQTKKIAQISTDNAPSLGDTNAPVTIIIFSDFQCSYCKKFHKKIYPKLKTHYIHTGLVRIVYRNLPSSMHENAFKAAEIAECAHEQDLFWNIFDLLHKYAYRINDMDFISKIPDSILFDNEQIKKCIASRKYKEEIYNDIEDAYTAEIKGTPTFVINNKLYPGFKSWESFKKIIEQELEIKNHQCY